MKYGLSKSQLNEVIKILFNYPDIEEAILFGSRAIDTFKEASDVDIAFKGKKVNHKLISNLKFYFEEETDFPFFFDFVSYSHINNKKLKNHIDQYGISIYKKGWRKIKLGDVCSDISYGYTASAIKKSIGPKFLRITDIVPDRINWSNVPYCKINDSDIDKYKLKIGDIVIARTGATTGFNKIIKGKIQSIFASYLIRYRVNLNVGHPFYIGYVLQSSYWTEFVKSIIGGSAQPGANAKQFASFEFSLPPLPEQEAIAEVLSSLDDKIELLHKQNKTLENIAQTLFHEWFIEDAKEDWEEKTLSDIMYFNPEYSLSKGTNAPYLEMKNVNPIRFHPDNWSFRDFTSGMRFKNGDTLLARITPCLENGKTCYVSFLNKDEIGWGSTEFIVMRMKEHYHKFISYLIAKDSNFRYFATKNMTGTSGRQRVQANSLKNFTIKIPDKEKIQELNLKLDAIQNKLFYTYKQIAILNKLRDTLLPKLMNGIVKVK